MKVKFMIDCNSEEENKKESEKVFSELKSEFLDLEIARDEFQKISSVITESIKPIAETYSKILSQIVIPKIDFSPMLSVIDKIRESYSYTFQSLINTFSSIDFATDNLSFLTNKVTVLPNLVRYIASSTAASPDPTTYTSKS